MTTIEMAHVMKQIGEFGGHPGRMATERSLYPAAFSLTEEAAILSRMLSRQRLHDEQQGRIGVPDIAPPSDFLPLESMG